MPSVKLTKNELKKQKDNLKRYTRYLPTLLLKKQQLQMVIRNVMHAVDNLKSRKNQMYANMEKWIAVLGENKCLNRGSRLEELVIVDVIERHQGNIAGVNIPLFDGITFKHIPYDLVNTPFWLDDAIIELKKMAEIDAEIDILERQVALLEHELRVTSQRVNLFEKIKIPETKENIRKIRIYLGDQQTAAVVRGKISKAKLDKVS